jgi:hypothetical protein
MRTLLLTLAFMAAATPAFATCVPLKPTGDRATDLANEQALTLCRAAELHARTAQYTQQLQFQADLQAEANNLQQEFRMQQTFAAAANAANPF